MGTKMFFASKTNWTGIAVFLLGIIPVVREMVAKGPISVDSVLVALAGILIVYLRTSTNDPIAPIQK